MYRYCQVCGNPIFTAQAHGTEADGRYSRDFCSNCYKGGQFSADITSHAAYKNAMAYGAGAYGTADYGVGLN